MCLRSIKSVEYTPCCNTEICSSCLVDLKTNVCPQCWLSPTDQPTFDTTDYVLKVARQHGAAILDRSKLWTEDIDQKLSQHQQIASFLKGWYDLHPTSVEFSSASDKMWVLAGEPYRHMKDRVSRRLTRLTVALTQDDSGSIFHFSERVEKTLTEVEPLPIPLLYDGDNPITFKPQDVPISIRSGVELLFYVKADGVSIEYLGNLSAIVACLWHKGIITYIPFEPPPDPKKLYGNNLFAFKLIDGKVHGQYIDNSSITVQRHIFKDGQWTDGPDIPFFRDIHMTHTGYVAISSSNDKGLNYTNPAGLFVYNDIHELQWSDTRYRCIDMAVDSVNQRVYVECFDAPDTTIVVFDLLTGQQLYQSPPQLEGYDKLLPGLGVKYGSILDTSVALDEVVVATHVSIYENMDDTYRPFYDGLHMIRPLVTIGSDESKE